MSLNEYLKNSGTHIFGGLSDSDIMNYETTVWSYLERLLVSKEYNENDVSALRCAFEVAAELHRSEKRNLGSPYVRHPSQVLERLILQGIDYITLAGGILHDTVESIQHRTGKDKGDCIETVLDKLNRLLVNAKLGSYVGYSLEVGFIVDALSKDVDDNFFQAIDQIFQLPENNLMRALIIKCTDNYVNTIDTEGYEVKEILYSVFKTFFVANETKRYMRNRLRFFQRAEHRVGDAYDYFRNEGVTGDSIRSYIERRTDAVNKRRFLFAAIEETLADLVAETNMVLDHSINYVQAGRDEYPEEERDDLRRKFWQASVEVEDYDIGGGFDRITEARKGSRLDGKMMQYVDLIKHKERRADHNPDLVEQYLDCLTFKKLLFRIESVHFRYFFLKGLERERLGKLK